VAGNICGREYLMRKRAVVSGQVAEAIHCCDVQEWRVGAQSLATVAERPSVGRSSMGGGVMRRRAEKRRPAEDVAWRVRWAGRVAAKYRNEKGQS